MPFYRFRVASPLPPELALERVRMFIHPVASVFMFVWFFGVGAWNNFREIGASTTLATFLILAHLSGGVAAQSNDEKCGSYVYEAVKHHKNIESLSPRAEGGNVISEVCRTSPSDSRFILSALAYDEKTEHEKKLVVAVVDKKTKRVISSFQSAISEDATTAVGAHSLKLDTARYQLATDVRAFGVRFTSAAIGPSCGEANSNDELTLFVLEGKRLRPVLTLDMYRQRSLQGCLSTQVPHAIWEDAMLTIGLEEPSTKGLHDLVVTARITVNSNGLPTESSKNRIERHTLRYDGKNYQAARTAPWWLGRN